MIHERTYKINGRGHLTIGGCDAVELAREYGTPLYVLDEGAVRSACREYTQSLRRHFGERAGALYAGKALCFAGLYKIIAEEGLGVDVVSPGEIYTAKAGGFDLSKAYFHGNNKTDADIEGAIADGVGCIVADNMEELEALNAIAGRLGRRQGILLRLSPGIDPGTHAKVATGLVDSKFGIAIATGQAEAAVKHVLANLPNVELNGIHCHIGSAIFDGRPYLDAARVMFDFMARIKKETGYEFGVLNIGGGFAVRYTENDTEISIDGNIAALAEFVKRHCAELGLAVPHILLEPGRSIVGAAGATLYTVGTFKEITGYKNYISVDGSMADNPRYALYGSRYTFVSASDATAERAVRASIVGRCCESGDILGEDVLMPRMKRGDILAVLVTGAFNYSMASNYNRLPRPALVMVNEGKARLAIRRESMDDLIRNDII